MIKINKNNKNLYSIREEDSILSKFDNFALVEFDFNSDCKDSKYYGEIELNKSEKHLKKLKTKVNEALRLTVDLHNENKQKLFIYDEQKNGHFTSKNVLIYQISQFKTLDELENTIYILFSTNTFKNIKNYNDIILISNRVFIDVCSGMFYVEISIYPN